MKAQANAVKVQESLLRPIAGSTLKGDSNPAEIVHLTVRVRPKSPRQQLVETAVIPGRLSVTHPGSPILTVTR